MHPNKTFSWTISLSILKHSTLYNRPSLHCSMMSSSSSSTGLGDQIYLCMTEPDLFRKTSFAPNTAKLGQNWTTTKAFLNLLKKLILNFCWICSILKKKFISFVSVHNLCLVKIFFLRFGPKCFLTIRLQYFWMNEINEIAWFFACWYQFQKNKFW